MSLAVLVPSPDPSASHPGPAPATPRPSGAAAAAGPANAERLERADEASRRAAADGAHPTGDRDDRLREAEGQSGGALAGKALKKAKGTGGGGALLEGKPASGGDAGEQPKKEPAVWKRDARRPSFARVYCGDGNKLEMVSVQVTVTVEGPRARTVVDHIFRNPHDRQLEGTFEYPLPTGASASYFAMFLGHTRDTVPERWGGRGAPPALPQEALARLKPEELVKRVSAEDWGRLQEGRVVGKEKALETYEEIVRGRIDPALLEYAGGNTFSGRVFPIPAKGYNRVILAYEELLPFGEAGVNYRFPLPDCPLQELSLRLDASAKECGEIAVEPADAAKAEGGGRLSLSKTWKGQGPGGEFRFRFVPPMARAQAISGRQDGAGPLYVYARLRPDLKAIDAAPFSEHAVFLLDTSMSESPDRFGVSVKLLTAILAGDPGIKRFNVLCFDQSAWWLSPEGWMSNDEAGRKAILAKLDGILLEGATDVSAALDRFGSPLFGLAEKSPLNVFVLSDGNATWGEKETAQIAARLEARNLYRTRFHCYSIGLGAENTELFESLTRNGGGIFNCFGEGDVPAAAAAHRRQCLTVEKLGFVGGPAMGDVLVAGRKSAVYPGGEIIVAARATEPGQTTVMLQGTFAGKPYAFEAPVVADGTGELAPRGWGEIAVASLLALNEPKLEPLAVAYCQQFGIGSRVASFLVLENDADYKRLNLQEERGKTLPGDLGEELTKLWETLGKPVTARQAFERFLAKADARTKVLSGPGGENLKRLMALLADADFELPAADPDSGKVLYEKDVPPAYLADRLDDAKKADAMITEAARRVAAGDREGAARALSGVVEAWPGRSDALRLVGYRLMNLKMPAAAARLFARVQADRPFEPHSYRDLARSLEETGKWALAAVNYEIALAGEWHNRFRGTISVVCKEEYIRMLRRAVRDKALPKAVINRFGERLEQLSAGGTGEDDLRITIAWNTDATDVDLWVIEPDGTKVFYRARKSPSGGELSDDMTQGYGPERYRIKKAKPGEYRIIAHYYSPNPNLIAGETHVTATVIRNADTPAETSEKFDVVLKKHDQQAEIARVKF
jgi:hypothetical protein